MGEKELPLIMIQENRSVWFIFECVVHGQCGSSLNMWFMVSVVHL